jgi:hypothetical protein
LQNRIYRGEIVHKDQSYAGEHGAIIDPALWDAVQARLAENAIERGTGVRVKNPSLLAGLLFDREGHRMTPTHAVKNGKRYRYYVSRPLIVGARSDAAGLRIPAAEIEQIVRNRIRRLLSEPASVFEILQIQPGEPMPQQRLMTRAAELAGEWAKMSRLRMRVIVLALVERVDMRLDAVTIHLRPRRLAAFLEGITLASHRSADGKPPYGVFHNTVAYNESTKNGPQPRRSRRRAVHLRRRCEYSSLRQCRDRQPDHRQRASRGRAARPPGRRQPHRQRNHRQLHCGQRVG